MIRTRFQSAKVNMVTTLLYQLVIIASGIVVPKFMILYYGSDTYGATSSITQFLSYVALLEGGIGSVARAELYEPLADGDGLGISRIYNAISRVFRVIGYAFIAYTVILACCYNKIADVSFLESSYTFCLVIAIGVSSIAQYFFGIANLVLLNADQKRYVSNMVMIVTTALNAILVIVLIKAGCDILTVKICSSSIFILRPVFFSAYVKRHYRIDKKLKPGKNVLEQKWTGLGQHFAYFLHTHTDVAVLTIMADLKWVSVYTVNNFVISSIRNIVTALTGGMEAIFGEIVAKQEKDALKSTYGYYDLFISCATLILFGTTAVLIEPFIRIYTKNITDAQYIQPVFVMVMLFAEAIDCMFLPCTTLPIAANKFKDIRWGAYGEALLNVGLSCVLVLWKPLEGIAIATAVSILYKNIFYFVYVSKNILQAPFSYGKRYILYTAVLLTVAGAGYAMVSAIDISSMLAWVVCGFVTFVCVSTVVLGTYTLIYGREFAAVVRKAAKGFVGRRKKKQL